MEITETQAPPAPPNIIAALRGGFDAIANRVYIILIPVLLDIWLWFGPHIQIKSMVTEVWDAMLSTPGFDPAQSGGLLPSDPQAMQSVIERVNLMTTLRSYPIGIPSLNSGSLPLETPLGSPLFLDVTSPVLVIGLWLFLSLLGLLAGTLYFILIAQAALSGQVDVKRAVSDWPRQAPQVVVLALVVVVILVVLLVPSTCILSFITMGGIPVNQIALVILMGMLIWVLFPLTFTPHGVFALRINLLAALQRSVVMTRMTLPTTSLFLLVILVASQGLDVLWRVPAENSWLMLVGLAGHAFAASALLAATFVYFRDADKWVQNVVRKMRLTAST